MATEQTRDAANKRALTDGEYRRGWQHAASYGESGLDNGESIAYYDGAADYFHYCGPSFYA